MSQATHTSTPWQAFEPAPDDPDLEIFEIWGSGRMATPDDDSTLVCGQVAGRANAVFIVRAANNFDSLMTTVRDLLHGIELRVGDRGWAHDPDMLDRAREALARAEVA